MKPLISFVAGRAKMKRMRAAVLFPDHDFLGTPGWGSPHQRHGHRLQEKDKKHFSNQENYRTFYLKNYQCGSGFVLVEGGSDANLTLTMYKLSFQVLRIGNKNIAPPPLKDPGPSF